MERGTVRDLTEVEALQLQPLCPATRPRYSYHWAASSPKLHTLLVLAPMVGVSDLASVIGSSLKAAAECILSAHCPSPPATIAWGEEGKQSTVGCQKTKGPLVTRASEAAHHFEIELYSSGNCFGALQLIFKCFKGHVNLYCSSIEECSKGI